MPTRTSYAHGTPNWIDLSTTDVPAARAFYASLFDWDYTENPTDQGTPYVMATKDGHPVAGMMQMAPDMQANGVPPMWNTYVAVDDVGSITENVAGAGGIVVLAPMQVMEHGHMAMISDPTGAMVGLWQAGAHIGAELVNEPGTLTWNECQTQDVDAAVAFYTALFGWGTQTMDMGEAGTYTVFTIDEAGIGGAMKPPIAEVPAHWSVVFAVADADETAQAIKDAGGHIHAEPFDMPVGRLTVGTDPTGAVFQAISLADPPA